MGYYDAPEWEEYPCEICGEFEDNCICPECPECSSYGDPRCYIDHGIKRTEEQKFSLESNNRYNDTDCFIESEYYKKNFID